MLLSVSSVFAPKTLARTVEYAMMLPNLSWKTTTMTAISKLRMRGPYRPGWENSCPFQRSVNVPVPLRTDEVKLKAKTVASGPSTNRPNTNQTMTVQSVFSNVVRRNGHLSPIPSRRISRSSSNDVLWQRRLQGRPLGPVVVERHRPGRRERSPTDRIGVRGKDGSEVERTHVHVRLNLGPEQEIDEIQRPRIRMPFDEGGGEDDRRDAPLAIAERDVGHAPRTLVLVEQGDAFVAQCNLERMVGNAEDVRACVRRLHDRMGQRPRARGLGEVPEGVIEEQHGIDPVVAQQRMGEPERRVDDREIEIHTGKGRVVYLGQRTPRERVPRVSPG